MNDLFETPELIPEEVMAILSKYENAESYEDCRQLETELNEIGYTIDWGLDAEPYNLRKLDVAQD